MRRSRSSRARVCTGHAGFRLLLWEESRQLWMIADRSANERERVTDGSPSARQLRVAPARHDGPGRRCHSPPYADPIFSPQGILVSVRRRIKSTRFQSYLGRFSGSKQPVNIWRASRKETFVFSDALYVHSVSNAPHRGKDMKVNPHLSRITCPVTLLLVRQKIPNSTDMDLGSMQTIR